MKKKVFAKINKRDAKLEKLQNILLDIYEDNSQGKDIRNKLILALGYTVSLRGKKALPKK